MHTLKPDKILKQIEQNQECLSHQTSQEEKTMHAQWEWTYMEDLRKQDGQNCENRVAKNHQYNLELHTEEKSIHSEVTWPGHHMQLEALVSNFHKRQHKINARIFSDT